MSEPKIDETKPSETKPRKVVGRNVAIALGIVCILLIAGLGGAMAYYTMAINDKDNQINSANNTINQLNSTIADQINTIASLNVNITNLTNEKNQLQAWLDGNETLLSLRISSLNAQITQLQTWLSGNITAYNSLQSAYNNYANDHTYSDEQYITLNSIIFLVDSTVWVNDQTVSQPAVGLGVSYSAWTFSASYAGYVLVWVQSSSVAGTHVRVIYSAYGVNFDQEIVVSVGGTAVFPILPSSILVEVGNANSSGGANETVGITYYY